MVLPIGTKVVIVLEDKFPSATFHEFEVGDEATAAGVAYEVKPEWQLFHNADGDPQYLLDQHFEVISRPAVVIQEKEDELVDNTIKVKAVYAVLKEDGEIVATTADRDFARELKSALGGKRKGVTIFQYTAAKEIR